MVKLSEQEIQRRLRDVRGWRKAGNAIEKEFKFKTFRAAIDFINNLAELAEKEEHHPDIYNSWRTVKLALTTHDEGGLTEYDFEMAKKIDALG